MLIWFKKNNFLYKNIVIKFDFTDIWEREFISTEISKNLLQYDKDIQERTGYAAEFEVDNFKNDLHYSVINVRISNSGLLSGHLYTDMGDIWEHPTMKSVLPITNNKKNPNNAYANDLILIYTNHKYIIFLKNWENPKFFTVSFPTLFLLRIRDHVSITHGQKKYAIRVLRKIGIVTLFEGVI